MRGISPSSASIPPSASTSGPEAGARLRATLPLVVPAVLWSAGIVASPLLAAGGDAVSAALLRIVYSPVCHQETARSFSIYGVPLAVCARCTGGYAAFTLTALLLPLLVRTELRRVSARAWLAGLAPLALDWLLDAAGLLTNSMASRTVTGAMAGLALAMIAAKGLERRTDEGIRPPVTDKHFH